MCCCELITNEEISEDKCTSNYRQSKCRAVDMQTRERTIIREV
jgi:hypothetical protein